MNCATEVMADVYTVPTMKTKESAGYYTLPIKTNIKSPPAIEEVDAAYEEITGPPTKNENYTNSRDLKDKVPKKCICIVILLTIAVFVASICFVAVFVEVATLPEISAMQLQQPALQEISTLQAQLNAVQQQQHALQEMVSQLNESTKDLYQMLEQNLLLTGQTSITSCAALPPSSPSGYYWVRASNGSAVRVYCDMTRSCGGITGGWTRVAELDTTSNGHQCPSGLTQRTDGDIRTCVRDTIKGGYSLVTFPTRSISYSRVCGRITGYQFGFTDGFNTSSSNINSVYLDGVSLTHGNPRQHIWSFAAGLDRSATGIHVSSNCPCQHSSAARPPSFVGSDYFCDAGNEQFVWPYNSFYPVPLWTNASCLCCTNPPWFYKQLPQPTTDNIEMRVCRNANRNDEDITIQVVEIYIQ